MNLTITTKNSKGLIGIADSILKKHKILGKDSIDSLLNPDGIPPHIKGQTVLAVIKRLKKNDYFSVCMIDNLAIMSNVRFKTEHSAFFSSLHCVPWVDMSEDTVEYLTALIVKYFEKEILCVS